MKQVSFMKMSATIAGTTNRQLLCGGTLLGSEAALAAGYLASTAWAGPAGLFVGGVLLGVHLAMCA